MREEPSTLDDKYDNNASSTGDGNDDTGTESTTTLTNIVQLL